MEKKPKNKTIAVDEETHYKLTMISAKKRMKIKHLIKSLVNEEYLKFKSQTGISDGR